MAVRVACLRPQFCQIKLRRGTNRDAATKPTFIRRRFIPQVQARRDDKLQDGNNWKCSGVLAIRVAYDPKKWRPMLRSLWRTSKAFDPKRPGLCHEVTLSRGAFLGLIFSIVLLTGGCATISPRNALPQASAGQIDLEGFHNIRFWGDASAPAIEAVVMADAPGRLSQTSSASNLLAISGGAEDGAFGAGLLVGWGDAGTRPMFDLVTGVSSGALIAPFVFLGRERDGQLREIFTKYGRKDIYTYNVNGLIEGSALADDTPLAHLIEKYVDEGFLLEIARERAKGRILLIGTTNLDTQRPVLWDMGRIAMSNNREAIALFRKILLASATLPGAFPPVRIKVRVGGKDYDELHVDGGITRQVFIAPSVFSFASGNQKPGRAVSKRRLYVIRNGKIDPEWQSVSENVLSITTRSISTLIKNQGIGDLFRIYSIAKRDGIDFNLASIPSDFKEVRNEPFDPQYMNALFDRGYDLASHNYSWVKAPPGLELATQARD
jgi:predicted acylesterase/phospholipase RssA